MTDPDDIYAEFDPDPFYGAPVIEGPAGPRGPSAGYNIRCIAEIALSGHRVVKARPGNAVNYPDLEVPSDARIIVGITTGGCAEGVEIDVQAAGEMIEQGWSWALGPVFCGSAGQLTQIVPFGTWLRQVGTAIAPDTMIINLFPPIALA